MRNLLRTVLDFAATLMNSLLSPVAWRMLEEWRKLLPVLLPILISLVFWLIRRLAEKRSASEAILPRSALRSLQDAAGRELEWQRMKTSARAHELRADSDVFATLLWESAWKSRVIAQAADGEWVFERAKSLLPKINAFVTGLDRPVATLKMRWVGKGELELQGGRKLGWGPVTSWGTEMAFRDEVGMPLVRFKTRFFSPATRVVIDPLALGMRELALLVLLGSFAIEEARKRSS